MKKLFTLFLSGVLAVGASAELYSQDFETGYFLGGNSFAFRMNPAFQAERGIFSIGLGQPGIGTWSNLGLSTFLYPSDNSVYTFMNDRVSTSEFLGKIRPTNSLNLDVNMPLLTLGFWSNETFVTLDFTLRSINTVAAPYDFFRFLKEGTEKVNTFDFSGMGLSSNTFGEAAFGWSRNFGEFNIGFRLKGMIGLLELEERMNDLKMTMNQEKWEVTGKGDLYASSPALRFSHNDNGEISLDSFDLNREKIAPAGYGGALDLGFTWNVIRDLTVSAAVLDLGAIYWIRNFVAHTSESGYSWTPSDKPIDPMGSEVQRELDRMGNALSGLFRFKDAGAGSAVKMLPWRMNVGAEYRMPFYDRLSVGALYTGRMGDIFSRHTGRFSVNWNPADFFSLSTSTALSNIGESIGFAMNLHPGGINLMVGCDYIPFRVVNVSPLFKNMPEKYKKISVVPANHMKMNLFVALHIAVGERRLDHTRRIDW